MLLCKLGFHHWFYLSSWERTDYNPTATVVHRTTMFRFVCSRCGLVNNLDKLKELNTESRYIKQKGRE